MVSGVALPPTNTGVLTDDDVDNSRDQIDAEGGIDIPNVAAASSPKVFLPTFFVVLVQYLFFLQ
jgi:hypothetical protein